MSRSACLIFNPVAGQGDSDLEFNNIKLLLSPVIDLDIRFTTPEVSAGDLAKEAIQHNVESIIVSGGDGTVSAVADAILGTKIPLGVISRGTANAFANALGIPEDLTLACQTIIDGNTRIVDAAKCNGSPMVLLAGIGFEAKTVENADREKKDRLGMFAYVLAGLKQLSDWQNFNAEIETEEQVIKVPAAAITVANAAPVTSVLAQGTEEIIADDGLLDITIIAPENNFDSLIASVKLYQSGANNEPVEHENIRYLRSKRVKVTTDPPQKVVIDGEVIETTPIEIESVPQSLTVYVPENNKKPPERIVPLKGKL